MKRSGLVLAMVSWMLALPGAQRLAAQGADAVLRGFEPSGDWTLVVEGKELPKARIYDSTRAQALLLMSAELPSPVLIDRATRSVATLDLMKVSERSDGSIDLLADAVLAPSGTIEIQNRTDAGFTVDGKQVVLKPRPWMLGLQRGTVLLEGDAGYRWRAKRYEPDSGSIASLRSERREVRILTFFGSWCPHCKEHLPLLLKTEQRLADAKVRFDYYGLPSSIKSDAEAAKWNVDGVPTAIVLVGGKEIGRIPNGSWASPEVALALLLHPPKG